MPNRWPEAKRRGVFTLRVPKDMKEQIRELVDAGRFDYMTDFIIEACEIHLKKELGKLEIEEARKKAEEAI